MADHPGITTGQPDDAERGDGDNRSSLNRPSILAIPRVVQNFASTSSSGYSSNLETMSHARTTADSKQESHDHAAGSVYSYNSTRDITQFVRELYGRTFNTLSDTYLLPTDASEWGRLDKQHSALVIAMNGLTPCQDTIDAILAFNPSDPTQKQILDVGCGTGSWAIEMAVRYPHAAVKGVDLSPTPLDAATVPPNLQFEIDDVNQGLTHFYDQYDVVHMRCTRVGITDFEKTMHELQLCLRPGGLLIIIDGDIELRDERQHKVKMKRLEGDGNADSTSDRGSWFQRIVWEAMSASRLAGGNNNRSAELIDLGLWDHPVCDPDTAVSGSIYLPIGPWAHAPDPTDDQALKYVGFLMRQVFLNIHRAYHVILRRFGMQQPILDEWSRQVEQELTHMTVHMWVRFGFCWARRRAGNDQPAPPLPPLPPSPSDSSPPTGLQSAPAQPPIREGAQRPRNRYPGFETFHTMEDAAEARTKRRATNGRWPVSYVERAHASQ